MTLQPPHVLIVQEGPAEYLYGLFPEVLKLEVPVFTCKSREQIWPMLEEHGITWVVFDGPLGYDEGLELSEKLDRHDVEFVTARDIGRLENAARRYHQEQQARQGPDYSPLIGIKLAEVEKRLILATLTEVKGNRRTTAKMLGIGLRTLFRKIEQYREEGEFIP